METKTTTKLIKTYDFDEVILPEFNKHFRLNAPRLFGLLNPSDNLRLADKSSKATNALHEWMVDFYTPDADQKPRERYNNRCQTMKKFISIAPGVDISDDHFEYMVLKNWTEIARDLVYATRVNGKDGTTEPPRMKGLGGFRPHWDEPMLRLAVLEPPQLFEVTETTDEGTETGYVCGVVVTYEIV